MKYLLYSLLAVSVLLTSGCGARRGGVVIDPAGVDMAQYHLDLGECQEISRQVDGKAVGGAVGGALVGGAVGGIFGNSDTAGKGAGAGAVVGAARGAGATSRERKLVVKNCLRNRGYAVLN